MEPSMLLSVLLLALITPLDFCRKAEESFREITGFIDPHTWTHFETPLLWRCIASLICPRLNYKTFS
jgi:hypothetical protein